MSTMTMHRPREEKVHFLLPSDARSSRWDLARDFRSPAGVVELCNALVPLPPNDSNPFFTNAIQSLLGGVISSLNRTQPGEWDLADVVRILEQRDHVAHVVARTDQYEEDDDDAPTA